MGTNNSVIQNHGDWRQAAPSEMIMPLASCWSILQTERVCGHSISLPIAASSEPIATLTTEPPYVAEPFTVQCIQRMGGPLPGFFVVLDTSAVTCKLMPCAASSLSVCDATLPVPAGAGVGEKISVPVPDAMLVNPTVSHNMSVTAQCVLDDNKAVYATADAFAVSCNAFPCQDAELQLCDTPISIKGGAAVGDVLNFTMPSPFVSEPFTVQCLGGGDSRPAYRITDASAVTCTTAAR